MPAPWIKLDRQRSPVQASVALVNALREEGGRQDIISLSIGAESEKPGGEIGNLLTWTGTTSPLYNSDVGGKPHVRYALGAWLTRFFGIPAGAFNSFLMQTNGRDLLNHVFHFAAKPHLTAGRKPAILLPDTSWPMVNESAADAYLNEIYYPTRRNGFADTVFDILKKPAPDGAAYAAVYTNTPHNPTGVKISNDDMRAFMERLEDYNRRAAVPVMHVIDNPYFAAVAQNDRAPYLVNGYEGVLNRTSITPWMTVISFSKAFGTAQPGVAALTVHDSLIPSVTARLARNNGLSYSPALFENMAKIFGEEFDRDVLAHFVRLRSKYESNHGAARRLLGGRLQLVDGDPNMTCLFEVPDQFLGQRVKCYDGAERDIAGVSDLVEFLANETGVVAVDNSTKDRNFLRFALREQPAMMEDAFVRIAGGLDKITTAPAPVKKLTGKPDLKIARGGG